MPDCRQLRVRAASRPASLRFREACELAECFGFTFVRQRGTSHRLYKRPGVLRMINLQPGPSGMAKAYQVRQLLMAIDDLPLEEEP
jgi:predicted RNA binding protein YcfA (HicA-like mRNA interferase family)